MFSRGDMHACNFRILEGDRKRLFEISVGLIGGSYQKHSDLNQKKTEQKSLFSIYREWLSSLMFGV